MGDLQIEILSPLDESYENTNDYSAVVHARFGGVTFLFTGDAEAAVEKALLEEYPSSKLRSDVLKVGHHGSKTSSTEAFLNAVHPEIAVIEVGADNSYGHPSQKVLDRLDALGSRVYRTDISGNIVLTTTAIRSMRLRKRTDYLILYLRRRLSDIIAMNSLFVGFPRPC